MAARKITIAIDGPAGVGKSSVGRALAVKYGLGFLSTGEMYRCLGWKALNRGLDLNDEESVYRAAKDIKWDFERAPDGSLKVLVDGIYLGDKLLADEVGQAASQTSALPKARAVVMEKQIEMGRAGGLVMEGRDIGTVICPQAPIKIFLTASAEQRARRRVLQLRGKGREADYEELLASIKARDRRDSSRAISPLKPAQDAVIIDTSDLNLEQVIAAAGARVDAVLRPQTPRPAYTGLYKLIYNLLKLSFRAYFRLFCKTDIKGLENIPLSGGLIIACNHLSNFDPPLAGGFTELKRDSVYFTKKELLGWPLLGLVFRSPKFIAVDRKRAGGDLSSLKAALKAVKSGNSLFIFPEGTRSKTGRPGRAKQGVGFLAYYSGAPVLPLKVINTDKLPFTRRVGLTVGKPFTMKPDETRPAKEQLQEFADRIMDEINKLD
ncbi:MAG: (d)CMP kinase [Elusimicrobiota bacterium]|jgi:cytidylate kinase|nr:(d)CMP kinase [Elusimicrobiota bacterium]